MVMLGFRTMNAHCLLSAGEIPLFQFHTPQRGQLKLKKNERRQSLDNCLCALYVLRGQQPHFSNFWNILCFTVHAILWLPTLTAYFLPYGDLIF